MSKEKNVTPLENNIEESREISIFEQIRKTEVSLAEDPKKAQVPMSMVFGHGYTGNLPSFGGRSLNENTQLVDAALAETSQLDHIWNHAHTQWTWKHINMSYLDPMKNMRQVAAEINSRRSALRDAKWRHIKNEARIRKIEEQLVNGVDDYWKEVDLKIKLAELKEGTVDGMKYIEGAMKDVLALQQVYQDIKNQVGNINEHDVELAESKAHLKRSLIQCIRDVRQSGVITKGEQEYVEQIGVNPTKLQKVIQAYVKQEEQREGWGTDGLFEFVDSLANELIDVYKVDDQRLALMGINSNADESISFINRIEQEQTDDSQEE